MPDDTKRRPPPRFPRPDDEVVVIPPAPDTERVPTLPPLGRREPFKLLREPPVDLTAQIGEVLRVQRKMAAQLDGYGVAVNTRFDIFHKELAMLRATVVGDHAPRLEQVEKTTTQKATGLALAGTKYGSYAVGVAVLARLAAKAFPQFGSVIEDLLRAVGL